jgi:hypothetical protein
LARLALNEDKGIMDKLALKCVELSLSKQSEARNEEVPASRLRWYSLADYLYSEVILRLITSN